MSQLDAPELQFIALCQTYYRIHKQHSGAQDSLVAHLNRPRRAHSYTCFGKDVGGLERPRYRQDPKGVARPRKCYFMVSSSQFCSIILPNAMVKLGAVMSGYEKRVGRGVFDVSILEDHPLTPL